jgi:hypothetical protein
MRQDRVELRRQHLLIDLHDNGHTKSMIPTSEDVQVNLRQALTRSCAAARTAGRRYG